MADEENEQSPWTRPGFIAGAVVVRAHRDGHRLDGSQLEPQ